MSEKGQIEGPNAVQSELQALGAEIKKLEEIIKTLDTRLRFVMVEKPHIKPKEEGDKEISISPLGLGIRQKCNLIEDLGEQVDRIIEDLEI